MTRLRRVGWAFVLMFGVVLTAQAGCSSDSEKAQGAAGGAGNNSGGSSAGSLGSEGSACYPNGTCNSGLSCLSKLCVNVMSGAGGTPAMTGGAPGMGGERTGTGNAGQGTGGISDSGGAPGASMGGATNTGGLTSAGGVGGTGGVANAGPNPTTVHSSSLQLWLTADAGIACDTAPTPNRVTKWSDQSGKGHDATAPGNNLGAQCNVALHTLHGTNVPYFANPGYPLVDYLDVDLSFLANTQFTLFAVVRVWEWPGFQRYQPFVGTSGMDLGPSWTNSAENALNANLTFVKGAAIPENTVTLNALFAEPAAPEPNAEFVMAWFDPSIGMQVWRNGTKLGEDTSAMAMTPLPASAGGRIGGSPGNAEAFKGDIAEVIVYTAALNGTERQAIEGYLKGHWGL